MMLCDTTPPVNPAAKANTTVALMFMLPRTTAHGLRIYFLGYRGKRYRKLTLFHCQNPLERSDIAANQLKEVARLDGWLHVGSAECVESLCEWPQ
jgi:hypothetical protein